MTAVNFNVTYDCYRAAGGVIKIVLPLQSEGTPTVAEYDAAVTAFLDELQVQQSGFISSATRTINSEDIQSFWSPS